MQHQGDAIIQLSSALYLGAIAYSVFSQDTLH